MKRIAKDLVNKLKQELLVLDWKKRQVTRARVQVFIEKMLDDGLPAVYDRRLYADKCSRVYEHVFEKYQGDSVSVYEEAA